MSSPEQKLAEFRARIDTVDEAIAKLMLERVGIAAQVAALKNANWPADCHIRSGREGQMHWAIAKRFAGTDVRPAAALSIWRQLIASATQLESPLYIGMLARDAHHVWLAREYFGIDVAIHTYDSLDALLSGIAAKESTIALLPQPLDATEALQLHKVGFKLFASLPAAATPLPNGLQPALAFAAITPEPSGKDISCFLNGKKIEEISGFHTAHNQAIYLGTYPRPVILEE